MATQNVTWNSGNNCYSVDNPDVTISKSGPDPTIRITIPSNMLNTQVTWTNWPGKDNGDRCPINPDSKCSQNGGTLSWGVGGDPDGTYEWDLGPCNSSEYYTMCSAPGDKPSMTVEP